MPLTRISVYLAGPISGLSYDEATEWRGKATTLLGQRNMTALSPLRSKRYLSEKTHLAHTYAEHPLSTQRGIVSRDHMDVERADAVLMNLLGAKTVSIGTMFEAAWSFQLRKPLVVVMEPGNLHEHPFVREAADYILPDLEEAIDLLACVLHP